MHIEKHFSLQTSQPKTLPILSWENQKTFTKILNLKPIMKSLERSLDRHTKVDYSQLKSMQCFSPRILTTKHFAQACVELLGLWFESTPQRTCDQTNQGEVWSRSSDKRLTSDSISRAINQIMSSYILLTARVRFCVINLRRNKR